MARTRGLSGLLPVIGLVTAGGLGVVVLTASGAGELVILGLLGLLAVAGAFLIFGLLFGFL